MKKSNKFLMYEAKSEKKRKYFSNGIKQICVYKKFKYTITKFINIFSLVYLELYLFWKIQSLKMFFYSP